MKMTSVFLFIHFRSAQHKFFAYLGSLSLNSTCSLASGNSLRWTFWRRARPFSQTDCFRVFACTPHVAISPKLLLLGTYFHWCGSGDFEEYFYTCGYVYIESPALVGDVSQHYFWISVKLHLFNLKIDFFIYFLNCLACEYGSANP